MRPGGMDMGGGFGGRGSAAQQAAGAAKNTMAKKSRGPRRKARMVKQEASGQGAVPKAGGMGVMPGRMGGMF